MDDTYKDFYRRQHRLSRKHRRLAEGYVTRVNKAGVIEHQPTPRAGSALARILILGILAVLGFKTLVLSWLGAEAYGQKLAALDAGSAVERAGAWIMQIDPVTLKLAEIVAGLMA